MDLEVDDVPPVTKKVCVAAEASRIRSCKKSREKVRKRINKAERERMKREHFNELFIRLAEVLELTENNGKASILSETTRVVKDMLSQIECLRKENITLLSESQYMETEKKELEDENDALQHQISELQRTLNEKMSELNTPPSLPGEIECNEKVSQQAQLLPPVYLIPACPDLTSASLKPVSGLFKPHPRYPTPADSWPSKILQKEDLLVPTEESSENGCNN